MLLNTQRFGQLEIDEGRILTFDEGLPGFEGLHQFVLLQPDEGAPFMWLQAAEDPQLAFVIVSPYDFFPSYRLELAEDDRRSLELHKPAEAAVFAIVVIPDDPREMTANLKAPLAVNPETRRAKQVIVNTKGYGLKHRIIGGTAPKRRPTRAGRVEDQPLLSAAGSK
ncbi:MAG TPA: flagellar assembly protein FliW [Bacillota bacterium]|jgi:flagellar assembly factor FliW